MPLCATLHLAERWARPRLPAARRSLAPAWGGAVEGAVLGAILGLSLWLGGPGGEFIYFEF